MMQTVRPLAARHARRRNVIRPQMLLLLAAASLLLLSPLLVSASSSLRPRTEVSMPQQNWSAPQLIAIVLLVLLTPPMMLSTAMLWRMRARFPIAGRGALSLLFIQLSALLIVVITCFLVLLYDGETACSMSWVIAHISIDLIAMPYLTRGWTLVVRLEIQSYLEEKQWREEKRTRLISDKAEAAGNTDDGTRAAVARVPDESDAEAPLPGLWYLAHRSWIRPVAIGRMWLSLALLVFVSCVIVAVWDPDAKATQKALLAQGYNTTVLHSSFTPEEFFSGPPCLSNSVKMMQFEAVLVLLVLPAAAWMTWKMAAINKRKKKRTEEQRVDAEQRLKQQQQQNGMQRAVDAAAAGAGTLGGSSLSDLSQHDSDRVQLEFALVCVITVLGISSYVGLQLFAPHFHSFAMLASACALWMVSIVWPIRDGIVISNRVKAMLASGSGNDASTRGGKSIGDRRLPHHRPYFNLRYLLSRDHTYPVLLSFLQKEFSSENALFARESHAFEAAAIKLQNACAAHWQLDTEEYEITVGGRGNSGGSKTMLTAIEGRQQQVQPRTSVVALRMLRSPSVNLQAATVEEIDDQQEAHSAEADSSPLPGSANLDDAASSPAAAPRGAQKKLAIRISSYQLPEPALPLPSPSLGATVQPSPTSPSGAPSSTDCAFPSETTSGAVFGHTTATVSMVRVSPVLGAFSGNGHGAHARDSVRSGTSVALVGVSTAERSRCWNVAVAPSPASPVAAVSTPLSGAAARAELVRLVSWSSRIFREYISPSARFQVNLPEDVSRVVVAQCDTMQQWAARELGNTVAEDSASSFPPAPPILLSSLFRAANREIMDLLEKDSLRRFVLTPAHRALIAEADQRELARIQKQQAMASAAQIVGQQLQRMGGGGDTGVVTAATAGGHDAAGDDAAAATDAEDL